MLKNDIFNCPIVVFEKLELERYNLIFVVILGYFYACDVIFSSDYNKFPAKLLTSSRAVIKLQGAILNHLKLPLRVENFHFLKRLNVKFCRQRLVKTRLW